MANKKINEFPTLTDLKDDDLLLLSSESETYNIKAYKLKEFVSDIAQSAVEKANKLEDDIQLGKFINTELSERIRPFNIFATDVAKIYKNSDLNLTTGEIKSGSKTVYELPMSGGEQYYINGLNNSRNHTLFLDAEMQYVTNMTAIGYYGAVVTLPENTAFVRFVHTVGYNPVIIDSKDYKKFKDGFMAELDESVDILPALPSALPSALHSALPSALPPALNSALPSALPLSLQNDFIQYINCLNPDTVTKGAFVLANGKLGTNANYDCSDYISISEGVTYYLFTRSLSKFTPRTVCYYDADKNSITEAFMDSSAQTSSHIIPYVQGAAYIRITLPVGKASDYLVSLDNNPIKFIEYGEYRIRDLLLADISFGSELKAAYSLCGGNAMKKYVDTATSGTVVTLPDFPRNLKKGLSLTFFGKFNDFTLLALGKGRGEYRGDWLEIDNKNIV